MKKFFHLESLVDIHEKNTERRIDTVVADSKYGSIENYPAGQSLKRRKFFKKRQHYEYIASADTCNRYQLKKLRLPLQ